MCSERHDLVLSWENCFPLRHNGKGYYICVAWCMRFALCEKKMFGIFFERSKHSLSHTRIILRYQHNGREERNNGRTAKNDENMKKYIL